eukprot:scaffold46298_cov62-Phaeocystis_antarctica.AAC.5
MAGLRGPRRLMGRGRPKLGMFGARPGAESGLQRGQVAASEPPCFQQGAALLEVGRVRPQLVRGDRLEQLRGEEPHVGLVIVQTVRDVPQARLEHRRVLGQHLVRFRVRVRYLERRVARLAVGVAEERLVRVRVRVGVGVRARVRVRVRVK